MKKKIGWIVLALGLVVLIAGASVLYNKYSAEVETERLMTADSAQAEIKEEDSEETATEADESAETSEDAADDTEELVMAPDFTV